jgi:uncharacterized protein YyaL (SSP411 family)
VLIRPLAAGFDFFRGTYNGEFFAGHYDVTDAGNFEGHNILNRLKKRQSKSL